MSDLEPKDEMKQGFSDMQYYYTELSSQIRKVHSEFREVNDQFRRTQAELREVQSQLRDNQHQFRKVQSQNDDLKYDIKDLPWMILSKTLGGMAFIIVLLAGIIILKQVSQ